MMNFKFVKKSFVAFIALVCVMSMILPGSINAKTVKKETLHYVALGDSLAAGYVPDYSDFKGASDTDWGYPEYLEARLEQSNYNTELHNLGVGGFQTKHVLAQLSQPAVIAEISNADIITLDIGANDVLGALLTGQDPTVAFTTAVNNIAGILTKINYFNPDAKVYVMGYYNLHPDYPGSNAVAPFLELFNTNLEQVAKELDATFVPTADIVGDNYESFLSPFDIHLKDEGYQAVGKQFWKALVKTKGWKQTDGE